MKMPVSKRKINVALLASSLVLAVCASALVFSSCDQPMAGLGARVDLSAPVIQVDGSSGPAPGSYVAGTPRFFVSASDDSGIDQVTITYTYKKVVGGSLQDQPPVTVAASLDGDTGLYYVDIDTEAAEMADGSLSLQVRAKDGSGRVTTSDQLIYTVKNKPPTIELQTPQPIEDGLTFNNDVTGDNNKIVVNTFILGIFQDLAGVAPGYPQIRIWADADGTALPPATDTANAGYAGVTASDGADDGWIPVDTGLVVSTQGERGGNFRYYLRNHKPDGSYPGNADSMDEIPLGTYSFQIRARDILDPSLEVVWPGDAFDGNKDRFRMAIYTPQTLPQVTIETDPDPGKMHYWDEFTLKAEAKKQGDVAKGIKELKIEVTGAKKGDSADKKDIILAISKDTAPDPVDDMDLSFTGKVGKSYYVEPGYPPETTVATGPVSEDTVPTGAYFITFIDGSYDFYALAVDNTDADKKASVSLYIDTQKPEVSVNSVTPYYSLDNIALTAGPDNPNNSHHNGTSPDAYSRRTVNSTVKIQVVSTDNQGNAKYNTGEMKFKYLFLKNADVAESAFTTWKALPANTGKGFGDYLYDRADAVLFDTTKAGGSHDPDPLNGYTGDSYPTINVSESGGAYELNLKTHVWEGGGDYLAWFYIVSQDNAGNTNYAKTLLNVNQDSDSPKVSFGTIASDESTFVDENSPLRVAITDDDGLLAAEVKYQFSKDGGTNWSAEKQIPAAANLVQAPDGSIDISALTLKVIYKDITGIDYVSAPAHPATNSILNILGDESAFKQIRIISKDDLTKKVYVHSTSGDGVKVASVESAKFKMDLNAPKIIPTTKDLSDVLLVNPRTVDNPFGAPIQLQGFGEIVPVFYGDIEELNPLSLSFTINEATADFDITTDLPATPGAGLIEVWRPVSGEPGIRWRFKPTNEVWIGLSEGNNTFRLQATDKTGRSVSKQIMFIKDAVGPMVNFITISRYRLTDAQVTAIKGGGTLDLTTQGLLNNIKDSAMIREAAVPKISGVFSDLNSEVDTSFWYNIDGTGWHQKATDSTGTTANWNIDLRDAALTPPLADGFHTLSIRVKDSGGNGYDNTVGPPSPVTNQIDSSFGAETNIGFILDTAYPKLVVVTPYGDRDTDTTVLPYSTVAVSGTTPVFTVKGLAGDSSIDKAEPLVAGIDANAAVAVSKQELTWRGSAATPPSGPAQWHAYLNTSTSPGKYYYYNGGWQLLGDADSDNLYDLTAGVPTFLWTYTLTADQLNAAIPAAATNDGEHKINFTVQEEGESGRTVTKVWSFLRDNTPPALAISAPAAGTLQTSGTLTLGQQWQFWASGTWINGQVPVQGTSIDTSGIANVKYYLGKIDGSGDGVISTGGDSQANYNAVAWVDTGLTGTPAAGWTGGATSWTYTNTNYNAYSTQPGIIINNTGVGNNATDYYLPLYIRAQDTAGNVGILHYNLWVDPALDKPVITAIMNPADDASVSGTVIVSGTAQDDDWVHHVEIRIKKVNEGTYYKNSGSSWITSPADGWVLADIIGSTDKNVSWRYDINGDSLLNPGPGDPPRPVTIEVRAVDTQEPTHLTALVTGDVEDISIEFDSNVPTISDVKIQRNGDAPVDLVSGTKAGGTFIISAIVEDEAGITDIQAKEEGSGSFITIASKPGFATSIPGWTVTEQIAGKKYKVSKEVNSTTYYGYGQTGTYNLELKVTDNNTVPGPNTSVAALQVQVDNCFPTANFTTQYNAATRNFYVSGKAQDTTTSLTPVQGLERVLVYFERGGIFMNAAGTTFTGNPAYGRGREGLSAPNTPTPPNASPTGINNFPVLALDGSVWKSANAMVIDKQELGDYTDSDADGTFAEQWEESGANRLWQARFNTVVSAMTDGPITVHYVIMDQAGNATHYAEPMYIRNNPPIIRQFTLATDLDGNNNHTGAGEAQAEPTIVASIIDNGTPGYDPTDPVSDDDVRTIEKSDEITSNFIVRNKYLNFNIWTFGGNNNKTYKVFHVAKDLTPKNSTALVPGQIYSIAVQGNTPWTRLGAPNGNAGTVFVATRAASTTTDDGDPTTGTASLYTPVANTDKDYSAGTGVNLTGDVKYTALDATAWGITAIADSITSGDPTLQHNKLFIIKVYDNTVNLGTEAEQSAHVALVNMDVDNDDDIKPTATIDPFYWNSGTDNSLYDNSKTNGHIELGPTPEVSGRISIRGTANDENGLASLWINMDNFDFTYGGSANEPLYGLTYTRAATYADGTWAGVDRWDANGWKFTAVNVNHDQNGHEVTWRLDIDTSKLNTNAVGLNKGFRIVARDGTGNDVVNPGSTQTTVAAKTGYYKMNVVPYITEVETRLSAFSKKDPSVYARTARGAYPVVDVASNNDNVVTVYGFNFGAVNPAITVNGLTTSPQGALSQGTGSRASWQATKIKLDSAKVSGPLALTVGSIAARNNSNDNTKEYNRQPNGVNNDTLTDDVALDVWKFTTVYTPTSEVEYPTMKIGPAGQIGFSFANDYQHFNMPGYEKNTEANDGNFLSQTKYQRSYGAYASNTFAFDAEGNTYGLALNTDTWPGGRKSANFAFLNRRPEILTDPDPFDNFAGLRLSSMRLENTTLYTNDAQADIANNQGNQIVDIKRIQSPAMVTSKPTPGSAIDDTNNRVNVYMAYYDRITGQVRFRAGSVGKNRDTTRGSDFTASASNYKVSANNHGLEVGAEVYLRGNQANINGIDRTKPYYVYNPGTNDFELTSVKGSGGSYRIYFGTASVPVAVSVTGGGLADLSGFVEIDTASRLLPVDPRSERYQVVASTGGYNAGLAVTQRPSSASGYPTSSYYDVTYPNATTHKPGAHVAIGVVRVSGSDVVVLAWYDETNERLVYSWNDAPTLSTSSGQWQNSSHIQVIEDYAGEGVSLATDGNGGIHLAYYSSYDGDLKYAYAPSYNSAFTAEPVKVDAYGFVGTQCTITVAKETHGVVERVVPYISYYAAGDNATKVKLAYRVYDPLDAVGTRPDAATGADADDMFTGAWEVSTVPTTSAPIDDRISVGVRTDAAGLIQNWVGGTNTPTTTGDTRVYGIGGINTPIVGYATASTLEMAQRKK
jgi:hypothetical protein